VGSPINSYIPLRVIAYFSFEASFERGTDMWTQRNESEKARYRLNIALRNYINKTFSKYTMDELLEIIADEESTLFFDGFLEYIKDNEGLCNVRFTGLRMVPR